jgi:hypothetical protein
MDFLNEAPGELQCLFGLLLGDKSGNFVYQAMAFLQKRPFIGQYYWSICRLFWSSLG